MNIKKQIYSSLFIVSLCLYQIVNPMQQFSSAARAAAAELSDYFTSNAPEQTPTQSDIGTNASHETMTNALNEAMDEKVAEQANNDDSYESNFPEPPAEEKTSDNLDDYDWVSDAEKSLIAARQILQEQLPQELVNLLENEEIWNTLKQNRSNTLQDLHRANIGKKDIPSFDSSFNELKHYLYHFLPLKRIEPRERKVSAAPPRPQRNMMRQEPVETFDQQKTSQSEQSTCNEELINQASKVNKDVEKLLRDQEALNALIKNAVAHKCHVAAESERQNRTGIDNEQDQFNTELQNDEQIASQHATKKQHKREQEALEEKKLKEKLANQHEKRKKHIKKREQEEKNLATKEQAELEERNIKKQQAEEKEQARQKKQAEDALARQQKKDVRKAGKERRAQEKEERSILKHKENNIANGFTELPGINLEPTAQDEARYIAKRIGQKRTEIELKQQARKNITDDALAQRANAEDELAQAYNQLAKDFEASKQKAIAKTNIRKENELGNNESEARKEITQEQEAFENMLQNAEKTSRQHATETQQKREKANLSNQAADENAALQAEEDQFFNEITQQFEQAKKNAIAQQQAREDIANAFTELPGTNLKPTAQEEGQYNAAVAKRIGQKRTEIELEQQARKNVARAKKQAEDQAAEMFNDEFPDSDIFTSAKKYSPPTPTGAFKQTAPKFMPQQQTPPPTTTKTTRAAEPFSDANADAVKNMFNQNKPTKKSQKTFGDTGFDDLGRIFEETPPAKQPASEIDLEGLKDMFKETPAAKKPPVKQPLNDINLEGLGEMFEESLQEPSAKQEEKLAEKQAPPKQAKRQRARWPKPKATDQRDDQEEQESTEEDSSDDDATPENKPKAKQPTPEEPAEQTTTKEPTDSAIPTKPAQQKAPVKKARKEKTATTVPEKHSYVTPPLNSQERLANQLNAPTETAAPNRSAQNNDAADNWNLPYDELMPEAIANEIATFNNHYPASAEQFYTTPVSNSSSSVAPQESISGRSKELRPDDIENKDFESLQDDIESEADLTINKQREKKELKPLRSIPTSEHQQPNQTESLWERLLTSINSIFLVIKNWLATIL